ncbi:MAG: hypothetical protein A2189_05985 [Paenibacillus sp. RIFOXYA1_FULL_44_5]|nr:MAG: hypothetical protein A2189_05985 [Paenibacillus sp. RIFOXYA1_FULL_44_5]
MNYQLKFDSASAYELVTSFMIYFTKKWTRNLEIGSAWIKHVDQLVPESFRKSSPQVNVFDYYDYLFLLAWKCPQKDTPKQFIEWLSSLSSGQIYEILSPFITGSIPSNLDVIPTEFAPLLAQWDSYYFQTLDPSLDRHIASDIQQKQLLLQSMDGVKLVELSTCGVVIEPQNGLDEIILIPTLHFRPLNNYMRFERMVLMQYSLDPPHLDPNTPPPQLMRLTRALADESRVRILKFIAASPKSFSEISEFSALTKGTVHHHMMNLRAAGLIRIHVTTAQNHMERFSFRTDALDNVPFWLNQFINQ